jgi:hypothetical protein
MAGVSWCFHGIPVLKSVANEWQFGVWAIASKADKGIYLRHFDFLTPSKSPPQAGETYSRGDVAPSKRKLVCASSGRVGLGLERCKPPDFI